jgi:hypothetical protein
MGRCPAVVEGGISWKADGQLNSHLGLRILLRWIFLFWGYLKEHDYSVPLRALEDFLAGF